MHARIPLDGLSKSEPSELLVTGRAGAPPQNQLQTPLNHPDSVAAQRVIPVMLMETFVLKDLYVQRHETAVNTFLFLADDRGSLRCQR